MNDYDRLQYYENCYDSFCSDFVIPRAQTSQSFSRPSSGVHRSPQPCSQFQASKSSSSKNNGLLLNNSSNHVYYFDSFSDAFSPLPGEDESRPQKPSHQNQTLQAFPALFEETDAESVSVRDDLKEGNPQCRNVMQLSPSAEAAAASTSSLQQLQFFAKKNKGPTPPPKPRQALSLAQPPLPPTATATNAAFPGLTKSSPELFHDHQHHHPPSSEMDPSNFILNPNMGHSYPHSNGQQKPHNQINNQRHLHKSSESISSCPIPPPPKYIRAPNNSHYRHMSVEMLPTYSFYGDDDPQQHRKLSEQQPCKPSSPPPAPPSHYKKKEVMSLSDFLKLSSATVFKKTPFSSPKKSGSSPLLCGHLPPSNDGAISSSPTPSTVSSSEAGGGAGSPSRSSVVPSFRKKCGVTKRRKKIDESLFTPHTTKSSSRERLHGGVNTCRKSSQNSSFPSSGDGDHTATVLNVAQHIATAATTTTFADSARYSITSFGTSQANVAERIDHHHHRHDKDDADGGDDDEGITFMAETNHDTDFELDPLPEKDPDDVMDFSWAPPISQPPPAPPASTAFLNNNNKKENLPVFHPPPPSSSLPLLDDRRNNNAPATSTSRKQSESKLQGNGSGGGGGSKMSKSNSAGGNGRPSSRCSLIINSLMGHLSGRNKSDSGGGAGASHQYSHHNNDIHNNNSLSHQLGGRDDVDHHDDDEHHDHHPNSSQTFGDDPTKPKCMFGKKSFQSKLKSSSNNKNDHIRGSNAKSHYHRMESPRPPPPPPPTQQKRNGQNGSQSTLDRGHRSRNNKGLSCSSEIINKNEPVSTERAGNGILGTSVWGRPRSIAAFNLDSDAIGDEADDYDDEFSPRHQSFHPPSSGSKSLDDINFGGHYHNDNYGNGSFTNLANVIGCIPRVSLSNNMKKCGGGTRQYESGCGTVETFPHEQRQQQHHHHPNGGFANNSKLFQESNADAVETVADYRRRRRTCCGGGLFGGDPLSTYDDDKFDKYYGDYSLTGLNIPMINNSDGNMNGAYTNSSNNGKPTEEVVLDRYYAHCNKVVRRKESQPSKQQQKKKKGHSLSEKIWRNVSLPIINSSCGNNNRKDGANLCDHQRAKQIEECFQCLSEREDEIEREKSRNGHNHQQHHSSNHNRKQQQQQLKKDNRRKTKSQSVDHLDLLGGSSGRGKSRETERFRQRRRSGGRDLVDNSGGHRHHHRDVGRTKLKKVSSSNSTSSGCSSSEASHCINPSLVAGQDKQRKNVQRLHHRNHQVNVESGQDKDDDDFGDEVIEDLSSSSCFSYSLQNGCSNKIKGRQEPKPPNATATKFKLKTTSIVSSNGGRNDNGGRCLISTAGRSNSFISSTTDQDDDEDHDSELDNVALASAKKIVASVNGEDYVDPKRRTVKAKTSSSGAASANKNKVKTNTNPTLVQGGGGKGERSSSTRTGNKNKSNGEIATTSPDYDDDDARMTIEKIDKKQSRQDKEMHLLKLKRYSRGREAMNPISRSIPTITTPSCQDKDDGVIQDSSSAISSLPTFSSSTPHLLDREDVDVIEGEKSSKDSKKHRVKWNSFITNGLAKATRKLSISGSGSRSSLGSSIVGSDSHSEKREKSSSSRRNSIIEMVGGIGRRRRNEKVTKEVTASRKEFLNDDATNLKHERSTNHGKLVGPSSSEINLNKRTAKSTEKLNKCKDVPTGGTKRRHTTDVFFRAGRHTGLFLPVTKTSTLRRNPSRKQRAATVQVTMPPSMLAAATPTATRNSYETHQAHQNPSVFMKKKPLRLYPPPPVVVPPPPPKLVKVVGIPGSQHQSAVMRGVMKSGVDHRATICNSNVSSVFSTFSTSSCNSSTSGSNRSSTSGYTSNVSRRTSAFLKSFRKRWAKKNNKVADGDEEDAHRTQHDPEDDDDDDDKDDAHDDNQGEKEYDNDNEDAITTTQANRDKHSSHRNHNRSHNVETAMALGTVNKLNTIRRKRRTPSTRASKHAIFSTFYIGPVIKDPMKDELIYVTKDFDDVTLDLQSGEVKKTSDGTLLFTADPLCFASRKQLKKKREKLAKLNRKLMLKDKQTKEEERTGMKNERRREEKPEKKVKQAKYTAIGNAVDRKGETNNKVISPAHNHHHQNPNRGEEIGEADNNPSLAEDSDDGAGGTTGKPREVISASNSKRVNCNSAITSGGGGGPVKTTKTSGNSKLKLKHIKKSAATQEMEEATTGKSNRRGVSGRSIISPRLIKSYLGISKDLLVGANGKNQSADDLSGNGGGEEPDTPTRSLLSRLKDSSRSGFGFSSNASGGGGAASRSSSKKRGSSSKQHDNGLQVSQTDSPKNRSSLSDSSGALGSADDGNDPEGVSGKLSTGHHHHQPSCSSEEELTSINSCENRLSSLTLGSGAGTRDEEGEYNGPFQGRAAAIVDCLPSPYDRNALRYKKGDIIDIIAKKPTGLWTGKVNNQIGYFKFINVELIPNPSTSSSTNPDKKRREVEVGDDEDDDAEDDVIDEDDSAGDYADTSNYTECSLHYGGGGESTRMVGEGGEQCSCPSSSRRVNDCRRPRSHHQSNNGGGCQGNSQRLAGAINPWEVEQRQSVANVINGYGASTGEPRSKKRGGKQYQGKGDPLGILNVDGEEDVGDDDDVEEDDDEDVDGEVEDSQSGDEVDEDDEEEENDDEIIENELLDGEPLNQTQMDGKRQLSQKKRNSAKASNGSGSEDLSNKKGKKQATGMRKGRPTSVGDLLQRINLEHYSQQLVQQGFETLDILKDLEEEDLDAVGILNETDRNKILRAVEFLRIELEDELDRHIPGQSLYQYRYYQATLKKPSTKNNGGGVNARVVGGGGVINAGASHLAPNGANNMPRLLGKGSPVTLQQTGTGLSSPHFYRLHHPRDSGIFVGKGDGEEDGDEVISGAELSCAESHPDVETEEIILSPINLQKTSSSSGVGGTVVVTGRAGGNGNPNPSWHPHHLHNNNNKQGSHHHINRFISKGGGGAPPGVILSGTGGAGGVVDVASNSTGISGPTAQQPTSSASSSGSSSSSSGIATAGDSFWNSVSSASNTNSNGSSSSGASSGPPTSSVVVDQNHSQWSKQGKAARDNHRHRRDASPAYNTESQRNRFLHAKSLFEPTNGTGVSASAVKSSRVAAHVYENGVAGGGVVVDEAGVVEVSNHLHLQRVGSQGKSLSQNQQQQNRFLYCEKSSDSGISVCTNSPPPLRNEFRN